MAPAKKSKKTADSINSRLALVMYVLQAPTVQKQLADVDHPQEVWEGYESHNPDAIATSTVGPRLLSIGD